MLLERGDVNPRHADTDGGRTRLCWAAANGHEGIVKVLLEREEVNPNQADTTYRIFSRYTVFRQVYCVLSAYRLSLM